MDRTFSNDLEARSDFGKFRKQNLEEDMTVLIVGVVEFGTKFSKDISHDEVGNSDEGKRRRVTRTNKSRAVGDFIGRRVLLAY
jgi:hypothetical protein